MTTTPPPCAGLDGDLICGKPSSCDFETRIGTAPLCPDHLKRGIDNGRLQVCLGGMRVSVGPRKKR